MAQERAAEELDVSLVRGDALFRLHLAIAVPAVLPLIPVIAIQVPIKDVLLKLLKGLA